MNIAIIGTAGRDKNKLLTLDLWNRMLADARQRTTSTDHLISGGAAWADHLAVTLFLENHVAALTLHLPAPFTSREFVGEFGTSGGASNYYHRLFSNRIGKNTLSDIDLAIQKPQCSVTYEPASFGYSAMFRRNKLVAAEAELLIAYTFGLLGIPTDGGTSNTWNQCRGQREHVPLTNLAA